MSHKIDGLDVQAIGVKELLHGHPIQVVALEGPRVLGFVLLHIPASLTCQALWHF